MARRNPKSRDTRVTDNIAAMDEAFAEAADYLAERSAVLAAQNTAHKAALDLLEIRWTKAAAALAAADAEVTDMLIHVGENPRQAEMDGTVKKLIAMGVYESSGSTVNGSNDPADFNLPEVRFPRDIRNPIMSVEIDGHRRVAMGILDKAAARLGQDSIICDTSERGGNKLVTINAALNRQELESLARIGAKVHRMDGSEVRVSFKKERGHDNP